MRKHLRYPDFLCIGAQKAGTSWLHRNLRPHPQLWLPPVKELHYFDSLWKLHPSIPDVWSRRWSRRAGRLLRRLKRRHLVADVESRWLLRYLFFPRNDRWYGSLFPDDPDLVVGEVTPTYAMLDADVVAHIATLMPRAKIIYILRNPVERSWSATAMKLENWFGTHIDRASDDEICSILSHQRIFQRADYLKHIDLWKQHFGKDNLFIGFYDDLLADPAAFLCRVFNFLGVESSDEQVPPNVRKPVDTRSYKAIPERYLQHLAGLHLDQIRTLNDHLPNEHTRRWLKEAEKHASPNLLSPLGLKGEDFVSTRMHNRRT